MIDKRLIPYGGLKKEPFSGSHNGMRYLSGVTTVKTAPHSLYLSIRNHGVLKILRKIKKRAAPSLCQKKGWTRQWHGFSNGLSLKRSAGRHLQKR